MKLTEGRMRFPSLFWYFHSISTIFFLWNALFSTMHTSVYCGKKNAVSFLFPSSLNRKCWLKKIENFQVHISSFLFTSLVGPLFLAVISAASSTVVIFSNPGPSSCSILQAYLSHEGLHPRLSWLQLLQK